MSGIRKSEPNRSVTQGSLIPSPAVKSHFGVRSAYPRIACVKGGRAWVETQFGVRSAYPRIACVKGGRAWVETKFNTLKLVDRKGSVKETIKTDFDFTDMTVTSDGDILMIDYDDKSIKSVSQQKGIRTLFRTSWKPESLCCLHSGDVVVTFILEGKVAVYSGDGKIRRTFDHIEFGWPMRVAVNKVNQDIYVCDHERAWYDSTGKVLAVGADGQLRYEYTGQGDSAFYPVEACSDLTGHILITDCAYNRVHILDQEGRFIQYILTSQQGLSTLTTIDVDMEGFVWVGANRKKSPTLCGQIGFCLIGEHFSDMKGHVQMFRYLC